MNEVTEDDPARLAVYGTLAPGRPNHRQLAHLAGNWIAGRVRGRLYQAGWGADLGFPGLVVDDTGDEVEVQILESEDLRTEWPRLDEFEGPGYRRVVVSTRTAVGSLSAHIYVLADGPELRPSSTP
jgi:gamma-glutamylcyclotransferase (GGCT)/AIG2-like uncharacterized protein YtfP